MAKPGCESQLSDLTCNLCIGHVASSHSGLLSFHCPFTRMLEESGLLCPTNHHQVLCAGKGREDQPCLPPPTPTAASTLLISVPRQQQKQGLKLTVQAGLHCHTSQQVCLLGVTPSSCLAKPHETPRFHSDAISEIAIPYPSFLQSGNFQGRGMLESILGAF